MASNLLASDVLDWQERIREQARRLLEGEPVVPRKAPPVISAYDTGMNHEPLVYREPNVINDPDSWLNRGLNNLVESAGEVILGRETGIPAIDYGVSNVPVGGAGAILAAGGFPGLIDVAGLGEVKGAIKGVRSILKNPIARRFAERYEPEAVDRLNKLVKEHPSLAGINTAEVYDVMQSGRLGNEYFIDLGKDYPEAFDVLMKPDLRGVTTKSGERVSYEELLERYKDKMHPTAYAELKRGLDESRRAYDMGDLLTSMNKGGAAKEGIFELANALDMGYNPPEQAWEGIVRRIRENIDHSISPRPDMEIGRVTNGDPIMKAASERLGEYVHLQTDPVSDWSRIIEVDDAGAALNASRKAEQEAAKAAAMERKATAEANKQAKAYEERLKLFKKNPKKAMKDANSAAPKMVRDKGPEAVREWYFGVDPMKEAAPAPAPKPKAAPVKEEPVVAVEVPAEPQAAPSAVIEVTGEPPVGGEFKWRENGWKSADHPLSEGRSYDILLGKNATEDDRRAAFVVDSLMNAAVGDIRRNNASWWIKTDGTVGFSKKGNHQLKPGERSLDNPLNWNDYRHNAFNYDEQRLRLSRDLAKNLATGNMPKSSKVVLVPAVNKATGNRIPGASVAKILDIDSYEDMFRPKVTRKIRETNPDYMR